MIDFIYSLMTDKRKGPFFETFKIILYILSLVYGTGIFARAILYKLGIFEKTSVPMKIISVGNLTLGGTGKTPFVIYLSKMLKDEIKKEPSVLIRGYGWDEQAMLKKSLNGIPILVGENRVRAAHRAIKLYGSETSILDDGFQYWELKRDLDIVLIDSRNPFGNNHLFPRGILRERKDAVRRADIIIFTKVNKKRFDIESLKEEIKALSGKDTIIFLEAMHRPDHLYDMKTRKMSDLKYLENKRLILMSSIGDGEYFEETVKDLNGNVLNHVKFGDHHNYSKDDIDRIAKMCDERKFDFLVTTEKDAVKLTRLGLSIANYSVMVLGIYMDVTSGKEILIDRLHSLYTGYNA